MSLLCSVCASPRVRLCLYQPSLPWLPAHTQSMTSRNNTQLTNICSSLSISPQTLCSLWDPPYHLLFSRRLALACLPWSCTLCSSLDVVFRYTQDHEQARLQFSGSIHLDDVADAIITLPRAPWHSVFPNCHLLCFLTCLSLL